jgi:hypothetical protein
MNQPISQRLREGTKQSHTLAENTAFMKCFLKGIVEREPFRKLTADLYYLYSALEEEIVRHRSHPVVGMIYFPELERKAKLEDDLDYYYGDNWQALIAPSPEGRTMSLAFGKFPTKIRLCWSPIPTCATWAICLVGKACETLCGRLWIYRKIGVPGCTSLMLSPR